MVGVIRVQCLQFCFLKMNGVEENPGREALRRGIPLDFGLSENTEQGF